MTKETINTELGTFEADALIKIPIDTALQMVYFYETEIGALEEIFLNPIELAAYCKENEITFEDAFTDIELLQFELDTLKKYIIYSSKEMMN